jgi:hypothetical protein
VAYLDVHYAEYQARCSCCKSFRSWPLDVPAKAAYDGLVRQAVLDRIPEDGLNGERTRAALKRDFFLKLSEGFLYDCLRWQICQLDLSAHRQMALKTFSGTLCVGELHLGRFTLLLATDPLADVPVAFAPVGRNDQDHLLHPQAPLPDRQEGQRAGQAAVGDPGPDVRVPARTGNAAAVRQRGA